ncbi:hypothetical protein SNEBB_003544 [Seison nebaliae]|nr:hypothetical protein SNEBB_003544 [Seison nebaliae]
MKKYNKSRWEESINNGIKRLGLRRNLSFEQLDINTNLEIAPENWLRNRTQSEININRSLQQHNEFDQSFQIASQEPWSINKIDVISHLNTIKKLVKMPLDKKGETSLVIHRFGKTLLIDQFNIYRLQKKDQKFFYLLSILQEWSKFFENKENIDEKQLMARRLKNTLLNQQKIKEKDLFSKFLFSSISLDNVPTSIDQSTTDDLGTNVTHKIFWNFNDMRFLIGTDLPIFGDTEHPTVSLRLCDSKKPIGILTGLDMWLDNLICHVPQLVMCWHCDGIVQKYERLNTEDIPTLSNFSPSVILDVAQNILSFLKGHATKDGHTYWLYKADGDEIVKLYDLTSLKSYINSLLNYQSKTKKEASSDSIPYDGNLPLDIYKQSVTNLYFAIAFNIFNINEENRDENSGTINYLLHRCLDMVEKKSELFIYSHLILSQLYVNSDDFSSFFSNSIDFCLKEENVNDIENKRTISENSDDSLILQLSDLKELIKSKKNIPVQSKNIDDIPPITNCSIYQRILQSLTHLQEIYEIIFEMTDDERLTISHHISLIFQQCIATFINLTFMLMKNGFYQLSLDCSYSSKKLIDYYGKMNKINMDEIKQKNLFDNKFSISSTDRRIPNNKKQLSVIPTTFTNSSSKSTPKHNDKRDKCLLYSSLIHLITGDNILISIDDKSILKENKNEIKSKATKLLKMIKTIFDIDCLNNDLSINNLSKKSLYQKSYSNYELFLSMSKISNYFHNNHHHHLVKQVAVCVKRCGHINNEIGSMIMNECSDELNEIDGEMTSNEMQKFIRHFKEVSDYFNDSLLAFESIDDTNNQMFIHKNWAKICRLYCFVYSKNKENELESFHGRKSYLFEEINHLKLAEKCLNKISLSKNETNINLDVLKSQLFWAKSTAHFNIGVLLQDNPQLAKMSIKDLIQTITINYLDSKNCLSFISDHIYPNDCLLHREQSVYHRLASLNHKEYRDNMENSSINHKQLKRIAIKYYMKSMSVFLGRPMLIAKQSDLIVEKKFELCLDIPMEYLVLILEVLPLIETNGKDLVSTISYLVILLNGRIAINTLYRHNGLSANVKEKIILYIKCLQRGIKQILLITMKKMKNEKLLNDLELLKKVYGDSLRLIHDDHKKKMKEDDGKEISKDLLNKLQSITQIISTLKIFS